MKALLEIVKIEANDVVTVSCLEDTAGSIRCVGDDDC